MMEKERKHWQEERNRKDTYIGEIQANQLKISNQMTFMQKQIDELEQDIQMRDQCESKVNQYVQELIDKNTDLES